MTPRSPLKPTGNLAGAKSRDLIWQTWSLVTQPFWSAVAAYFMVFY